MQKTLMQLNLYGCEAVGRKLKKRLKNHFLGCFALTSDSLTTIKVKLHQCLSHRSILLTQGPLYQSVKKFLSLSLCLFLSSSFHALKGIRLESTQILFKRPYSQSNNQSFSRIYHSVLTWSERNSTKYISKLQHASCTSSILKDFFDKKPHLYLFCKTKVVHHLGWI